MIYTIVGIFKVQFIKNRCRVKLNAKSYRKDLIFNPIPLADQSENEAADKDTAAGHIDSAFG